MSGYLLDTNVISMLSPARPEASRKFLSWLERVDHEGRLFLSVITIHEIEKRIALLEHKGAAAKAATLASWLSGLRSVYDDKIVGFDLAAAALAGQFEAKAISAGVDPGMADAIIAGIAKSNDLHIVTRNVKHFRHFDVAVSPPDDAVGSA